MVTWYVVETASDAANAGRGRICLRAAHVRREAADIPAQQDAFCWAGALLAAPGSPLARAALLLTKPMATQALYQKQGRSAQFASVAERDKWLREEIRKLQEAQSKTGSTRRAVQDAAASLNSELMELSQVLPFAIISET